MARFSVDFAHPQALEESIRSGSHFPVTAGFRTVPTQSGKRKHFSTELVGIPLRTGLAPGKSGEHRVIEGNCPAYSLFPVPLAPHENLPADMRAKLAQRRGEIKHV